MKSEMNIPTNGEVKPPLRPIMKCGLLVTLREDEHYSLGIAEFCQKVEQGVIGRAILLE